MFTTEAANDTIEHAKAVIWTTAVACSIASSAVSVSTRLCISIYSKVTCIYVRVGKVLSTSNGPE
jgi:hypothetical protein